MPRKAITMRMKANTRNAADPTVTRKGNRAGIVHGSAAAPASPIGTATSAVAKVTTGVGMCAGIFRVSKSRPNTNTAARSAIKDAWSNEPVPGFITSNIPRNPAVTAIQPRQPGRSPSSPTPTIVIMNGCARRIAVRSAIGISFNA